MTKWKITDINERQKVIVEGILLAFSFFLIFYFHVVQETGRGFTHLFYVPIILACFWWQRKGLIIAAILGIAVIISHNFLRTEILTLNDYVRAFMFIIVAFVISALTGQLKKDREKLRIVSDYTYDCESWTDINGNYIHISASCERITGYNQNDFLSDRDFLEKITIPEDRCHVAGHCKKQRDKNEYCEFDFRIITKSGKQRWIGHACQPVYSTGGKYLGIRSSNRDITERKNAEEKLRSSKMELRKLTGYLQSVRENERVSIAREIHDELGQALTALKMDLSWLNNKLPEDQKLILDKIHSMIHLTDTTIKSMKKVLTELRPALLDDLGLDAAIEWQAEEFEKRTGITCEIDMDIEDVSLGKDLSIAFFRIFQETLTNVARHAMATNVEVELKKYEGRLTLEVSDNGKGIEDVQIDKQNAFGIIGIRERAKYFGGEAVVEGIPGKGTTVTVNVPLNKGVAIHDKNSYRR